MRRLFSSERPGKRNYENYYPKDRKGIPKAGDQKSGLKDGAGDQGRKQENFLKQIQDLMAPLLFMGFVLISLLLTPQQQKQGGTTLEQLDEFTQQLWLGDLLRTSV